MTGTAPAKATVPAGLVALLLYLYPALVALLATIFLRERLTPARIAALVLHESIVPIQLTGRALILAAVSMLARPPRDCD